MSKFGRVKNLRLVRHIVTGASCGYAFVEFETEEDLSHAYEGAHLSKLDGASILVDYNRQQLMPGWIPRRLGGGLGGKKESGQLRFGGRDRPFRAPLRPIPHEELQKLGIPLPPEGRYLSRFQVPPPPQRKHSKEKFNFSEAKHHRVQSIEEDNTSVKDKATHKTRGSESGEVRERDRHRRRRDEFRDQVDGDHLEAEERRSYRKHGVEERGHESRRESKYEGFEFEQKRPDSKTHRDEYTHHGGERDGPKRRKEQSLAYHEDDEEDRKRRRRRQPQDGGEHLAERSEDFDSQYRGRRNRTLDYHTERFSEQREPDPEQSRSSRDTELGDAHGRHRESRYRSEDKSDHWQPTRENDKKHRHSDSKHRRRDRNQGSPQEDEGKPHRSDRKHKHRERSGGENPDIAEKQKKKSKHRERDI